MMQGGSVEGAIAYRQFEQSDNPYDPICLKNRTGTVLIEPLQPVKPANDRTKKSRPGTNGSAQPGQPPHSA